LIDTAVNTDGLTTPQGTALPESNGMTDVLACVKGNILNEVDRLTGTGLLKACGANVALGGKERALHRVGSNPLTIPHFQSQPVTTKVDKSDKWFSYTYNAAQRVVQKYRSLTSFDVQTENWSKYEKTQLTFVLLVSDMQFSDYDPAFLLQRAFTIVDRRRKPVSFQTMWTNLKKKHINFFEKNPPFVKLTKQEVETLEMLFEQQEPPAAAAKPIASPEPHLHATITDIEAHKGHCHNFTVRYQLQDQPNVNGNAIVTSTDGNFHLPLTGGYVWDDDSRENFRKCWETQNPIDLTLDSPDPENTALPNSRTLLEIQHDGNVTSDGKIQFVLRFTYSNHPIDEQPYSTIVLMSSGNLSDMEDPEDATCPWTKESHDMFRAAWKNVQDQAKPPTPSVDEVPSAQADTITLAPCPNGEPLDGSDSPCEAPSHCNSTPVPLTNSQSMGATKQDAFVDGLLGPGHRLRGTPLQSPSGSQTPVNHSFDRTPLVDDRSYESRGESRGDPSPIGRRTPSFDRRDEFGPEFQSRPNSPYHCSAQPGIHNGNDEKEGKPGDSPTTPRSPCNEQLDDIIDCILDNGVKAADGGKPEARQAINKIADAGGIAHPYLACDFHNAAEMEGQPLSLTAQRNNINRLENKLKQMENKLKQMKRKLAEDWNAMDERAAKISKAQESKVMKGQQQAKQEATTQILAFFRGRQDRKWRNHLAYELKVAELVAAQNIQAFVRGASGRQLCQQLARKAALMRLANERRQEADKAEREAKRLRQEADEALSELNELTNV